MVGGHGVVEAHAHVAELDVARDSETGRRVGRRGDGGLAMQHLGDAAHRGRGLLVEVDRPAEGDHRPGQQPQVRVEQHQVAQRHCPAGHKAAADQQHDRADRPQDECHRRPEQAAEQHVAHVQAAVLFVGLVEHPDLGLLLGIGFDRTDAAEVFLRAGRDIAELILDMPEDSSHASTDDREDDRYNRQQQQHQQRERGVGQEHHGRRGCDEERGGNAGVEAWPQKLAHGRKIVGDARHEVAGVHPAVEALLEREQAVEQCAADVELDQIRDAVDQHALAEAEAAVDQGDQQHKAAVAQQLGRDDTARIQVVDNLADDQRDRRGEGGGAGGAQHAEQQPHAVARDEGQQVTQMFHWVIASSLSNLRMEGVTARCAPPEAARDSLSIARYYPLSLGLWKDVRVRIDQARRISAGGLAQLFRVIEADATVYPALRGAVAPYETC